MADVAAVEKENQMNLTGKRTQIIAGILAALAGVKAWATGAAPDLVPFFDVAAQILGWLAVLTGADKVNRLISNGNGNGNGK